VADLISRILSVQLYDKIRRSDQKHRVAIEVLAYHSVCTHDEIHKIKAHVLPERIETVETFDFNSLSLTEIEKPLYAIYMFKDLFGLKR
jgi:cAMP and cAMP-inhibited cGMP 3',5'-cyclic phosphodiesterase 10